jgi:pimeloyl-ACP methyl ester carboxylesterase
MNTTRIVYLHGFASGPFSQKAQFFKGKFAEEGVALTVPDLAEGDFRGLTVTAQLQVVERLAGDHPVALIGSSLGGYLAALFAARHPQVERAVLLAPAFGFIRRWSDRLGPEAMAQWRRTGALRIPHYGLRTDADLGYQLIEDGALYEDYPDVRQPALIYHGDGDDVVSVDLSREFASRHLNARLVVVRSGHELTDVLDQMWQGVHAFLLDKR